ncbi:MAG: nickel-type superoxide dismutase maturation protease [Candidatus Limnocylindria bacterium]
MSTARGLRWPLIGFVGIATAAAFAWRRFDAVEVRGRSMAPTLLPGDRLLVARRAGRPSIGEVVLATDPRYARRELIKRVTAIRDGHVTLRGDAPGASTDSRSFGALPVDAVRWRVLGRFWPPARIGAIPARAPALVPVDEGGEAACTFPEALIAGD